MTKILIIDIETTGLDRKDQIIEFGAALCDWETKKPVYLLSENIQYDGEIDPKITDRTGIETYMVKSPYAVPLKTALFFLKKISQKADYYCTQRSKSVFNFILPAAKELGIELPNRPIIDCPSDLPVKMTQIPLKLNHLLSEYGLLNPFSNRAVLNSLSVFKLMQQFPLSEILELQRSEMITIKGNVGYAGREMARAFGFHWDAPTKNWLMEIKKARYETMKKKLIFPFPTQIEFELPF